MTVENRNSKKTALIALSVVAVLMLCAVAGAMVLWSQRATELRRGVRLPYLALAYTLYAEQNGDALPPLEDQPGVLSGDMESLYPEFFSDLTLLFNPANPTGKKAANGGMAPQEAAAKSSYVYLGAPVASDEEVAEWAETYRAAAASKQPISTAYEPWVLDSAEDKDAPLLIELPHAYPGDWGVWLGVGGVPLSAPVEGGLVAYPNGSVRFIRYPGPWPMTEKTISQLREIRALRGELQVEAAADAPDTQDSETSG